MNKEKKVKCVCNLEKPNTERSLLRLDKANNFLTNVFDNSLINQISAMDN